MDESLQGTVELQARAPRFSPAIYRRYNLDLRHLSDAELEQHFRQSQHEARIYGSADSTVELLSMRWLRGSGLEIGAGGSPTPLFGNAAAMHNDCDPELAFGGKSLDLQGNIDDADFVAKHVGAFDFVVASHVLEHADSFLRALENMCILSRAGGMVYIVLPDVEFLHDRTWMPHFAFDHHVTEYDHPLQFVDLHDSDYIRAVRAGIDGENLHAVLPEAYRVAVRSGVIEPKYRFFHHKHNYSFGDWIELLVQARAFLKNRFELADVRYGHERLDCHFVLRTTG